LNLIHTAARLTFSLIATSLITLFVISVTIATPERLGAESTVRLLVSGHGMFAPPLIAADEIWFALESEGRERRLRSVKPTASAETPICGLEGTHIAAEGIDDGFFLIGGAKSLSEGPVTTTVSSPQFLYPGQTLGVLPGYMLEVYGTATWTEGGGMSTLFLNYSFWIRHQDRRQLLLTRSRQSDSHPPRVVWAGDLDRDGVPDLILDMPDGDVGGHLFLFLSSMATSDQLVSPVASHSFPGC
jgi:hypothetical protein